MHNSKSGAWTPVPGQWPLSCPSSCRRFSCTLNGLGLLVVAVTFGFSLLATNKSMTVLCFIEFMTMKRRGRISPVSWHKSSSQNPIWIRCCQLPHCIGETELIERYIEFMTKTRRGRNSPVSWHESSVQNMRWIRRCQRPHWCHRLMQRYYIEFMTKTRRSRNSSVSWKSTYMYVYQCTRRGRFCTVRTGPRNQTFRYKVSKCL